MKKLKFFVILSLLIGALCALCSCGAKKLASPTDIDLSEELVLTWSDIEDARRYMIEITDASTGKLIEKETPLKESWDLYDYAEGNYVIKIKALGDGKKFKDSDWVEYDFTREYDTGCLYKLINSRTEYEITKSTSRTVGDVFIEDKYRGKPVTSIAKGAFKNNRDIINVEVGAYVTKIGESAFQGCTKLETVTFKPDSRLTTIGKSAFNSCSSLKSINIPEDVKVIEEYTFQYCRSLLDPSLQEGLTTIGKSAFSNCSALTEITIPNSVTTIGEGAFEKNTELTSVTVGDGVTALPKSVFYSCTKLQTVDFSTETNLKTIGDYAFSECSAFTTFTLPEGVESLGEKCFDKCLLLEGVELPQTLSHIGENAFSETKLYQDGITSGYVYADKWLVGVSEEIVATLTALDDSVLESGTLGIADKVFYQSESLVDIFLPSSVKYIGNKTFSGIKSLRTFDSRRGNLIAIGERAFEECSLLQYLYLNDGLKTIDNYAFYECSNLKDKRDNSLIPDTVTRVGTYAFHSTGLWSNPDTETGIVYAGKWVVGFNGYPGVVELREGTVGIADYAFYKCASLDSITNLRSIKYIGEGAFYESNLSIAVLNPDLKKIEDYTFYKCDALSSVSFPNGLEYIGRSAFYQCNSLGQLDLSNARKITTIGDYAFYRCEYLEDITLSSEAEKELTIGNYAFYKCIRLKRAVITDNVVKIGNRAYYGCEKLETVVIGKGITEIDEYTFAECAALQMVTISDSVKTIDHHAFYKCTGLRILNLGSGVETIGNYAFYGCEQLTRLILPENVETIGNYAFKGNANLQSLLLKGDVKTVGAHAFYGCKQMTVYTDCEKLPEDWAIRWNSSHRPVVWGCELDADKTYVVSVTVGEGSLENTKAEDGIKAPVRLNYTFGGWATNSDGTGEKYTAEEIANAPIGTTLYAIWTLNAA